MWGQPPLRQAQGRLSAVQPAKLAVLSTEFNPGDQPTHCRDQYFGPGFFSLPAMCRGRRAALNLADFRGHL
jgi:hypothetical protein